MAGNGYVYDIVGPKKTLPVVICLRIDIICHKMITYELFYKYIFKIQLFSGLESINSEVEMIFMLVF